MDWQVFFLVILIFVITGIISGLITFLFSIHPAAGIAGVVITIAAIFGRVAYTQEQS